MATYDAIAKYIAERTGPLSAMKLQKLMYYSQAWHLVWEEEPLFNDDFQAWANGPVLPALYNLHRGLFKVDADLFPSARTDSLSEKERSTVDGVLEFYGSKTAQWLSDLTHKESPWLEARGETPIGAASCAVISHSSMHEYYSSL